MPSRLEEYYSNIQNYYNLKHKFEQSVISEKKKYLSNKNSLQQNKQLLSKLNYKCINCKQLGGTIFSSENNTLKAVCGNKNNPCKLNIVINKGNVDNILDIMDNLTNELNKLKFSIIALKLDYIFNYKNDEDSIKEFESLNETINKTYKEYNTVLEKYLYITNNKDNIDNLRLKHTELYELIDKIKYCNKLYNQSSLNIYVKEAVDIYINKLVKLSNEINDLKYKQRFVDIDKNDNKLILCTNKFIIEDFEIFENYNIEKFDL